LPSSPLACNSTGWCRIWWGFRCPKILKDNTVYNNVRYLDYLGLVQILNQKGVTGWWWCVL
jgi:hypothetical protein